MELLHPVMSILGVKGEEQLLVVLAWAMIASGVCSFVALQVVRAPYGKYWEEAGKAYGCMLSGRLAWLLQEAPAFALPVYFWISEGSDPASDGRMTSLTPNTVLMAMFLLHYLHRTFIFPFRLRGGKPTPFLVFLLALVFCLWNGCVSIVPPVGLRHPLLSRASPWLTYRAGGFSPAALRLSRQTSRGTRARDAGNAAQGESTQLTVLALTHDSMLRAQHVAECVLGKRVVL
jgi:hypothetical protein